MGSQRSLTESTRTQKSTAGTVGWSSAASPWTGETAQSSSLTSFVNAGLSNRSSGSYPTDVTAAPSDARSTATGPDSKAPIKARIVTGTVSTKRRTLMVVRGAERVDRVFPGWVGRAYGEDGVYEPYDLNLPARLPRRRLGPGEFHNDTPITRLGEWRAAEMGRGLRLRGIKPDFILASPALRSVQTAAAIAAELGDHPVICVEPGLFEPLGWYEERPAWMSLGELSACGLPVSLKYRSVLSAAGLTALVGKETDDEAQLRIGDTLGALLDAAAARPSITLTLVVAHAATQQAALASLDPDAASARPPNAYLGLAYPYTSVLAFEERGDTRPASWALHRRLPALLPHSHSLFFSSVPAPLLPAV